MSWLHCFWGVGTIVSPFVMSYALARSTWNGGYRIVGILQLGIALLLLIPMTNPMVTFAGFIIIGFGCAPIYPCIIHSTPDNFGAENSGAIIGIQMASAYVGSTFMPPLYGLLGSRISFRILPVYLAAFVLLMIAMSESTFKTAEKEGLGHT